ncbi:MAG TPA: ChaN family lipoprotein, partial [Pseudomonadales bacterium]
KPANVDQLVSLLEQQQSGWDYRHMYAPVFEQVLQTGFALQAANIPRDQVIAVMQQGEAAMPAELRRLIQQTPLTPQQTAAMQREAVEAHCNSLPEQMVAPMIQAQRLRDAAMALSLSRGEQAMKILITGSGHARKDRGVPLYLRSLQGNSKGVVSLGFMEVQASALRVDDYAERWDDSLPFDYVWFTAQFDRADPCKDLHIPVRNATPAVDD